MNPVHIATNDYASSGVYIRTPEVNNSAASVEITTLLTNDMHPGYGNQGGKCNL